MLTWFKDDRLPKFQFTVKDEDGVVVNLSNPDATAAVCLIRKEDAVADVFSGAGTNATFIDKTVGRVDYLMPTGGIDAIGIYSGQLKFTFADGSQHTERFQFEVKARLGA